MGALSRAGARLFYELLCRATRKGRVNLRELPCENLGRARCDKNIFALSIVI